MTKEAESLYLKKSAAIEEISTVCDVYNLLMHGEALTKTSSVSHGELNRFEFSVG